MPHVSRRALPQGRSGLATYSLLAQIIPDLTNRLLNHGDAKRERLGLAPEDAGLTPRKKKKRIGNFALLMGVRPKLHTNRILIH
jgi:hypothetical protein